MRLLRFARNDGTICILFLFPLLSFSQFTDKTFDAAFRTLKDGTYKVDSLNKFCRTINDDGKAVACGIRVRELAGKLNYKKGAAQSLHNIGIAYYNLDKYSQALDYYHQALEIRKELMEEAKKNGIADELAKCKKDVSASYTNMGNAYDNMGDKKKAIDYHTQSLYLKQELKDTIGMAKSYNNIASAYLDVPNYYQAIDFGFKSVRLFEAIHDKSEHHAKAMNNIGIGYERLKEFDKALNHYQKALILQQELQNQIEIARMFNNIGNIYLQQGQKDSILRISLFRSALDNYLKSLYILKTNEDKNLTARVYNNIGNTYWELRDFEKALPYLNNALDMYRQLDAQRDIAIVLNSLATYFQLREKFDRSEKYALDALAIADSIDDAEQIKNASEILSDDYSAMKQFKNALFYYKRFTAEKDSLTNVQGAKDLVQKEEKMKSEIQRQKMLTDQKNERDKAEAKSRTQKYITWTVAGGLLLVLIFSIFILNRWRITQRQKKIIEMQKAEVDTQRELADSRRIIAEEQKFVIEKQKTEVEQQKKLVEEHQKEIIASITYAKRLQEAILPPMDFVKKHLPEVFILYKPKDIVAGDFYWMEVLPPQPPEGGNKAPLNPPEGRSSEVPSFSGQEGFQYLLSEDRGDVIFIAAADCTGHGVPGAMVSVVCSNALNRTVKEFGLRDTGKILDKVTELVLETFEKSGEDVKDGMDISLLSIKFKSQNSKSQDENNVDLGSLNLGLGAWDLEVQWSGANNPLWYVQNGELINITADKQPIGKHDNRKPFTTHTINLQGFGNLEGLSRKPITFYLFTDGYADQFGGPHGKKFKYKQFEEKLVEISGKSLEEQRTVLDKTFAEWKGNLEQVDDVCIIGIRI